MEKNELIEKLQNEKSLVNFYEYKKEIIKQLKSKKKVKKEKTGGNKNDN